MEDFQQMLESNIAQNGKEVDTLGVNHFTVNLNAKKEEKRKNELWRKCGVMTDSSLIIAHQIVTFVLVKIIFYCHFSSFNEISIL